MLSIRDNEFKRLFIRYRKEAAGLNILYKGAFADNERRPLSKDAGSYIWVTVHRILYLEHCLNSCGYYLVLGHPLSKNIKTIPLL